MNDQNDFKTNLPQNGEEPPRQRRSAQPFSRVSGSLNRAGDGVPPQGLPLRETPAEELPPENPRAPRRPVPAAGYRRAEPLGTAVTTRDFNRPPLEDNLDDDLEPPRRRGPAVLAVLVLVLAALVLGFLLIPTGTGTLGNLKQSVVNQLGGLLGKGPETTQAPAVGVASDLTAAPAQGTAPMTVVFTLSTRGQVDDVQLVDEDGNVFPTALPAEREDNTGLSVWVLELPLDTGYTGSVAVQLRAGETWYPSGLSTNLSVAPPETALQPVQAASEPVEDPEDVRAAEEVQLPQVYRLEADSAEGTAPMTITFQILSDPTVEDIRLVGQDGTIYPTASLTHEDLDGNRQWTLISRFVNPVDDELTAEAFAQGEWIDTYEQIGILVESPEPVATPEPAAESERVPRLVASTRAPQPEPEPESAEPVEEEPIENGVEEIAELAEELPPEEFTPLEELTAEEPVPAEETEPAEAAAPETASAETAAQEAAPEAEPWLTFEASEAANPAQMKAQIFRGTKKLTSYQRDGKLFNMPGPAEYLVRPFGVLTFRASSFRQNAAYGTIKGDLTGLSVKWQAKAGRSAMNAAKGYYYGIGRGSQPVIVKWASDVRELTNMTDEKKLTAKLKEVIIAGEDGYIYFLDLTDGTPTRNSINVGYPLRGTPSVHPKGFPYMAVGQYARKMLKSQGPIGLRTYDLLTQKEVKRIDGTDGKKSKRPLSGLANFDTCPLIDANSDTMVAAGGNGLLYVTDLGAKLTLNDQKMSVAFDPTVVLQTQGAREKASLTAVQSSLAGYQGCVFYADKGGYLRCVDVNTMTVVWAVQMEDAVEAAVALDLDEAGTLWLYTATTLQNRNKGDVTIRRYNAQTGEESWKVTVPVAKEKKSSVTPGAVASPVIGTDGLNGCVYYTLSNLSAAGGEQLFGEKKAVPAALVCLDKESGRVRWTYPLASYTYSSPVAVYNEEGKGWIIQAESNGTLTLLDGENGSLVSSIEIEGVINGSPAVYLDTLVIGTQGADTPYIYGITLE